MASGALERFDYVPLVDPGVGRRVEREALWRNPEKRNGGPTPGMRQDGILLGMSTLKTVPKGQLGAFANGRYKGGPDGKPGELVAFWEHEAFATRAGAEARGRGYFMEVPLTLPGGQKCPPHMVSKRFLVPVLSCTARFINDGLASAPANVRMRLDPRADNPQQFVRLEATGNIEDCEELTMEYGWEYWADESILRGASHSLIRDIVGAYPQVEAGCPTLCGTVGMERARMLDEKRALPIVTVAHAHVLVPSSASVLRRGSIGRSFLETGGGAIAPIELVTPNQVQLGPEPSKTKRRRSSGAGASGGESVVACGNHGRVTRATATAGAAGRESLLAEKGPTGLDSGMAVVQTTAQVVGGGVLLPTAGKYLKVGQRFGEFLLKENRLQFVREKADGYGGRLSVDYKAMGALPEEEVAQLAIGYGEYVISLGRKVGSDHMALRWCFTTFALKVPHGLRADSPALAQAIKGWIKRVPKRVASKDKEKRYKAEVPGELMWHIIISKLRNGGLGTREKFAYIANLIAYSKGKRGATVIQCTRMEEAQEERDFGRTGEDGWEGEEGDGGDLGIGALSESHAMRAEDIVFMDDQYCRLGPRGLCDRQRRVRATNDERRAAAQGGGTVSGEELLPEEFGSKFMMLTSRSDKMNEEDKTYLYRRRDETGDACPWGSELSDWLMDLMEEVCLEAQHLADSDNLFSFRRTVIIDEREVSTMSVVIKKDVVKVLKTAAEELGLPPQVFALHCYRHTFKTQQKMSDKVLGAQSREEQEALTSEWKRGSSAPDGYIGATCMGYDNLRTLSRGIPGTVLTMGEVKLKIPTSLCGPGGGGVQIGRGVLPGL